MVRALPVFILAAGDVPTGTSRTTGSPRLAITTSSPACAALTSCERRFLASRIFTCTAPLLRIDLGYKGSNIAMLATFVQRPRPLQRTHLPRNTNGAFERRAVPAAGLRCSRIGGRQEVEQQSVGLRGIADRVVWQDKLAQHFVEVGARRYRSVAEACRFGIGIGIEGGLWKSLIAWPEPGAADLVRIGFARDRVGQAGHTPGMARCRPPGEAGHREVEAAPKEMDRARLAQKAGAKALEDAIDLHQRAPEAMGSGAVVGSVGVVLRKADGVRHLVRHLVDDHRDADAVEQIDQAVMKVGNRLRLEWELPGIAAAGGATRRWL